MLIKGYSKHITELDGLRGLACIFVLIHHYFTALIHTQSDGFTGLIFNILQLFFVSGVDLFFVLSGFLVGGIIIDNFKSRNFVKVFFIKRIARIFPVYYLLIFSYAIGVYFLSDVPWTAQGLLKNPYPFMAYFTYIQSYLFGLENDFGPLWVAVTWSVSVEEQFYLLIPFIFLFFGRRSAWFIVVSGLVLAPVIRYFLYAKYGYFSAYMMYPARMDSIFWGVALAFLLRSDKWRAFLNKHSWIPFSIILITFLMLALNMATDVVSKFSLLALFYTGILWTILEGKVPLIGKILHWNFLVYTGSISYAVYMFHQLVNCVLHGVLFESKPTLDGWDKYATTCLSIGVVYLLCHFSLKYIENPIRKFSSRFHYEN